MSNKEMSDKLGTPFPRTAIKTRKGGGGKDLSYVEGHTVIHRLNEATTNTWDLEVREITTLQLGERTLLQARVALTIPGLGTREHIGVQAIDARGGEDLVKGVITDALKKAATLFGVGLELYGPDYEAGEIAAPRQDAPVRPQEPRRDAQPRQQASRQGGRVEQEATPRQVQFIAAIARELGMSEEELRAESSQSFSRDVSALNRRDASIFIERLQTRRNERMSGRPASGPPDPYEPADDTDSHNDSDVPAMIEAFNRNDLAAKHRQ